MGMRGRGETDDELMEAVAGGDRVAFDILVRRHRSWVCAMLVAMVRDPHPAEDLTQETFCRVYAHAGDYVGQGQFAAWVRRIAGNLARSFVQRRRETVPLDDIAGLPAASRTADPEAALMAVVVRDELRDAVLALRPSERETIVLRYFGALSVAEIAGEMGCREGTVKSRIHHALRHIGALIDPAIGRIGENE